MPALKYYSEVFVNLCAPSVTLHPFPEYPLRVSPLPSLGPQQAIISARASHGHSCYARVPQPRRGWGPGQGCHAPDGIRLLCWGGRDSNISVRQQDMLPAVQDCAQDPGGCLKSDNVL